MSVKGHLSRWTRDHPDQVVVGSYGKIADAVLRTFKGKKPVERPHLTNRIRALDNGNALRWWKDAKRKVLIDRLAAVLRATPQALVNVASGPRRAGESRFAVPEWPELGEVDLLGGDLLFEVGGLDGIGHDGAANLFTSPSAGGLVWVQMPPGAGRSLAVAWHQSRRVEGGRVAGASLGRVALAVERRRQEPEGNVLLVELGDLDPDRDAAALREVVACRDLWILSTAPLPAEPLGDLAASWTAYEWTPPSTWKASFARWMMRRARSPREPRDFIAMIERIDARRNLPFTPRDLLHLGRVWAAGVNNPADCLARSARASIEGCVRAAKADDAEERTWFQACARHALEHGLEARWTRSALPWDGPLDVAVWGELLPSRLAPVKQAQGLHPLQANGAMAVHLLRRTGLLAAAADGTLRCASVLMEEAAGQRSAFAATRAATAADEFANLGLSALGSARRPLFDAVLQNLESDSLAQLIARVLPPAAKRLAPETLGARALLDALYVAAGWRLGSDRGFGAKNRPLLERLFRRAWAGVLHRWEARMPALPTRPGPGDGTETGHADEVNAFIAACWNWSFAVGPPLDIALEPGERWLFPGWHAEVALPPHISAPLGWVTEAEEGRQRWPAFNRLLVLADDVMKKAVRGLDPGGNDARNTLLGPLLIRCALEDVRYPGPIPLAGRTWTGQWVQDFHDRLTALDPDDHPRVARYLLRNAAHDNSLRTDTPPLLHRLRALQGFGDVGKWARDRLGVTDLDPIRGERGLGFDLADATVIDLLHWLTQDQAKAVLEWISVDDQIRDADVVLLSAADRWTSAALLAYAAGVFPRYAWRAYQRMWSLDAQATVRHGESIVASSDPRDRVLAKAFIGNVPWKHAAAAAHLLKGLEPAARPDWTAGWAHRVIAIGGPAVDEAWTLLQEAKGTS